MILKDKLILLTFGSICAFSTYISFLVRYHNWNQYFTFLPSILFMLLFSYATKYGEMPLKNFSAWYNSIGALTGVIIMHFLNEKMSPIQFIGVLLISLGLFLMNKR